MCSVFLGVMVPGVADPVVGLKLALTAAIRDALIDQQLLAEFLLTLIQEKVRSLLSLSLSCLANTIT